MNSLSIMSSPTRFIVFLIIGLGIAGLFFVSCVPTPTIAPTPVPTASVLPVGEPGTQPGTQPVVQDDQCGITSCHGLDITCGSNAPEMCTLEYRLGDFCRQFAQCQVIDGSCEFVENQTFTQCKACVEACESQGTDPLSAFDCESTCRDQFN